MRIDLRRPIETLPLRTTRVGASVKYTDGYGNAWEIDEVAAGAFVAICDAYSPKGKVFGSSLDDTKIKIEKWAFTNRPGTLFTEFGGIRVDGNGAFWSRVDHWKPVLEKYPPGVPTGIRYTATSGHYAPPAKVEAMTELDLASAIDAYAETHKPAFDPPPVDPKAPIPPAVPSVPPVTPPPPGGSGPAPVPPTTPVPPSPVPTPPVASSDGGTLLYASGAAAVAGLIAWAALRG